MHFFWIGLSIVAAVGVLRFLAGRRNGSWGGLMLGFLLGLIVAGVSFFLGHGFAWSLVGKIAVVCSVIGFGIELLLPTHNSE